LTGVVVEIESTRDTEAGEVPANVEADVPVVLGVLGDAALVAEPEGEPAGAVECVTEDTVDVVWPVVLLAVWPV